MIRQLAVFSFCLSLAGMACAAPNPVADRPRVILVRPVILCDDDGSHPARYAFTKKLVDRVYTRADLEFLYLAPTRWNFGKALRGEIDLDRIVAKGRANGKIATDPRVLTLLFVSAVGGQTQPLGRGLQNGDVCFVSLGPPGKMADPAKRAFVVAHEVGHCLNLIHAVDDPKVPDDVPNLEGDGSFDQRIAVEGLHPSQVETVLASPLVLPRLHFHSAAESARLITRDAWDNPLDTLNSASIRFALDLDPETPLPEDPAKRLAFVRREFASLTTDFSEDERALLSRQVGRINQLLGERWPAITRVPWHFIKMKRSFCHGLPHTRGLAIVLTAPMMEMFAHNENRTLELLIHEKLHILQRLMPQHFAPAYRRYGFEPIRLPPGTTKRLDLLVNPDAPIPEWAIRHGDGLFLLAASPDPSNDGKSASKQGLYPLHPVSGETGLHAPGSAVEDDSILDAWRARIPIRTGHDDPREVMAYLLGTIFQTDILKEDGDDPSPGQRTFLDEERKLLPKLLGLPVGE